MFSARITLAVTVTMQMTQESSIIAQCAVADRHMMIANCWNSCDNFLVVFIIGSIIQCSVIHIKMLSLNNVIKIDKKNEKPPIICKTHEQFSIIDSWVHTMYYGKVVMGRRTLKFTAIQRKIPLSLSNLLSFASKSFCKTRKMNKTIFSDFDATFLIQGDVCKKNAYSKYFFCFSRWIFWDQYWP